MFTLENLEFRSGVNSTRYSYYHSYARLTPVTVTLLARSLKYAGTLYQSQTGIMVRCWGEIRRTKAWNVLREGLGAWVFGAQGSNSLD